MSTVISNLTSWIQAVLAFLFGGSIPAATSGGTATTVTGVFPTILAQPVLVALLIGVPLCTLLISIITRLLRRSAR